MDAPLILQLSALVATAGGSAFATKFVERWVDARRKKLNGDPPPISWQDALTQVNTRMTELVNDMNLRMQQGFVKLENSILAHNQVAFPALERQVARLDLALAEHTGRVHEEIDARLHRIESHVRCGAKDCPLNNKAA